MMLGESRIERVFVPKLVTLSIQVNKSNGIKVYKCHDRMFDSIVERANKALYLF